jgi:hypothetical protein
MLSFAENGSALCAQKSGERFFERPFQGKRKAKRPLPFGFRLVHHLGLRAVLRSGSWALSRSKGRLSLTWAIIESASAWQSFILTPPAPIPEQTTVTLSGKTHALAQGAQCFKLLGCEYAAYVKLRQSLHTNGCGLRFGQFARTRLNRRFICVIHVNCPVQSDSRLAHTLVDSPTLLSVLLSYGLYAGNLLWGEIKLARKLRLLAIRSVLALALRSLVGLLPVGARRRKNE